MFTSSYARLAVILSQKLKLINISITARIGKDSFSLRNIVGYLEFVQNFR